MTVNVTVSAPTTTAGNAALDWHVASVFEIASEIAAALVPVRYARTGEVEAVNDWASAARYPCYQYGFDEAAGNFQMDNYGKGGLDNDAILAHSQDATGINNAVFMTPIDSQQPRAQMLLFDFTTPNRDSDSDLVIPHHEFFHGVSNRLTGGPANSDWLIQHFAFAVNVLDNKTIARNTATPFVPYVAGNPTGLRTFPFRSDLTVNPSTYSCLGRGD
ncbi:hypothetical protein AMAG_17346 [Allomyces macrogynus ATCC 38327]|uniref:Extracellular metalloproteinase n=1 Tax=Allomyces macrogynus (strain ATCC 38327) TaxID=578462 RepID=A0A0L0TEY5_ALLM3|nr:hypothetical protein AMAG_17346 [Allomyces macrogynus ATCC 38327]|eukprot:KNE73149.1 hypothetical protein AMAG_17346 [Allomyces macrogynus ATCC 38327]